ncbi:uncharacterized protein RSE6_12611 [Rhynchosporium secalis]|uniref:Uncharacterized protein n=1 Tax=Rhynchosporium secalis TaxID=38038 RepID=A0A1E1MQU1_RHYSE|nr:uncharacterized protein RSE6_12611 [Rhynchosporium secalis]
MAAQARMVLLSLLKVYADSSLKLGSQTAAVYEVYRTQLARLLKDINPTVSGVFSELDVLASVAEAEATAIAFAIASIVPAVLVASHVTPIAGQGIAAVPAQHLLSSGQAQSADTRTVMSYQSHWQANQIRGMRVESIFRFGPGFVKTLSMGQDGLI